MDELEQFDSMNWLQTTHQPKALRSPDITKQLQEKSAEYFEKWQHG